MISANQKSGVSFWKVRACVVQRVTVMRTSLLRDDCFACAAAPRGETTDDASHTPHPIGCAEVEVRTVVDQVAGMGQGEFAPLRPPKDATRQPCLDADSGAVGLGGKAVYGSEASEGATER